MNSLEVALCKEADGQGHLRKCLAETGIQELHGIFDMLSADELRHAEALRALQYGARVELPQSPTLDGAREILRRFSVRCSGLSTPNGDLLAYLGAMDFESSTARACSQLARKADSGWERDLLQRIAEEDEIHFTLLEHIRETLLEPDHFSEVDDGVSDAC